MKKRIRKLTAAYIFRLNGEIYLQAKATWRVPQLVIQSVNKNFPALKLFDSKGEEDEF